MPYKIFTPDVDEIIKDIEGFEGYYQITSKGRVISLGKKSNHKSSIELSTKTDKYGYKRVVLQKNKSRHHVQVHRLVAEAFIEKIFNKDIVNHKDSNRANNCVENLEWVDAYGNYLHSPYNKSEISVIAVCKETKEEFRYKSLMDASRDLNINQGNITNCLKGRCKSVGGFYWRVENEDN